MYSANTRGWVYLARQGRAGKGVIGSIGTQWEWSRSGQFVPCGGQGSWFLVATTPDTPPLTTHILNSSKHNFAL